MEVNGKRICSKCKEVKSYKEFYYQGTHFINCSSCREISKKVRKAARQEILERARLLGC